ncbi:hypothetical protein [Paraburkholderia flagellata]|uniref:hypothetical protein n=1 Tax=Paraburkholderia flagellata TaxID=2883241 RepID=UPI001F217B27|nr:hypothetical protein [Paraburkholderia flagellata]
MEFFGRDAAISLAVLAADESGLPQTVYSAPFTAGWANTHSLARVLDEPGSVVFVTMLPRRYFL